MLNSRYRIDANRLMWAIHEYQRLQHHEPRHGAYVGFSALPLATTLVSLTEHETRPPFFADVAEKLRFDPVHELIMTQLQAREALDIDNFMAELTSYAESEEQE